MATDLLHLTATELLTLYRNGKASPVEAVSTALAQIARYPDLNCFCFVDPESALKQAKEDLHREKERAHVTLESIGDGVITTDLNCNIEYMNTVAEQSTGWKLEDARGNPIMDVFRIVEEKSYAIPIPTSWVWYSSSMT